MMRGKRRIHALISMVIISVACSITVVGQQPQSANVKKAKHFTKLGNSNSVKKAVLRSSSVSRLVATDAVSVGPVYADRKTKLFYWPGCPNFQRVALKDRQIFGDDDEAKKAGYKPAGNCQ